MKEIRDIMIAETYTNAKGEEKTAWTKIGTMFIKMEADGSVGHISMQFKAYPAKGENPISFPRKNDDQFNQTNRF